MRIIYRQSTRAKGEPAPTDQTLRKQSVKKEKKKKLATGLVTPQNIVEFTQGPQGFKMGKGRG